MATLALRLCGDVTLTSNNGVLEPPLGSKTLGLLAFLALEPGRHQRHELTTLLWGEYPEEKAKASLRQALTHLRDAVGDVLLVDRTSIELADGLTCDVTDFLKLATTDPAASTSIDVPSFLAKLRLRNCPAFDDWADLKRGELLAKYRQSLSYSTREALARRSWRDAAQFAERWRGLDPLADEAVAALMEAQHLAGDHDAARTTYSHHTTRLAAEAQRRPGRAIAELASRLDRSVREEKPRTNVKWYERAASFTGSLVGRTNEWDQLQRAWTAVSGGGSRIVVIEGESGVGKTRLADDFVRWLATRNAVVVRGRAYDSHAGPPFAALMEALRSAVDAPGVAGVDPEWLSEIGRLLPDVRRHFPGLPEPHAKSAAADGWRLFEAVAQVLIAIAEDSPVVVVIDDLQWADADSCSLLHFLVRRLSDVRVLWCVTFTLGEIERDAPAARLTRALRANSSHTSIALQPLSEDDVWHLIRDLGRIDAPNGGRRLAARLHEATGGNPFYVIELLKTLFSQAVLTVDPQTNAWIVPSSALAEVTPAILLPTVHDAIAERIECLPERPHTVLVTIAVAGRGCRTDVLSHMHGISRLHAAVVGDALVERHLVVEENGRYRCAHPIIAHVVRAGLSTSRRCEVHRALAQTLELLLPTSPIEDGDSGEIARHAEAAGDRSMAHRYALLASDACSRRCAYDEALSWLDLAAGTAVTAGESEVVDRATARVLEKAGWREVPPVRVPDALSVGRVARDDLDLPAPR